MIRNYIKVAWRNLRKQKLFSFVNLFGLTTGLTCFLLIALYIFDEITYDRFHKKGDRIYRITETKTNAQGKESRVVAVAANIASQAKSSMPEIETATRFSMLGRSNVSNPSNTNVFYESFFLADSSFFKVFDFPFIQGDPATALSAPNSVVLNEETSIKLFGTKHSVGQSIQVDRDSLPYQVTGVVRIPDNSHLQFNTLFSEASLYGSSGFMDFVNNDWSSNTFVTYLLLNNKVPDQTAAGITKLVKEKRTGEQAANSVFALQPLPSIHFHSAGIEGATGRRGNLNHMYIFGIVALFVLLIACINYMNLTTARFAGRSKEIAVRKVAGASRPELVRQFMAEAGLLTSVALIFSLAITKLLLPWFNSFTEKELQLGSATDYRIWIGIVVVTLITAMLSGIYPALFQSGLKPWVLLKNKINTGKGHLSIRKMLVVFQFSLSIIMIIATIVVFRQMRFLDTADMGFNKDQLLVVDINSGLVRRSAESIKTEFSRIPGVNAVSVTSRVPGEWKVIPKVKVQSAGKATTEGEDVFFMGADENFRKTFEVKLLSGRNFTGQPGDSSSVLLNEAAARLLGINEAVEQLITIPTVAFSGNAANLTQPFTARVVGIVNNFNFQSMREEVAPMVIGFRNNPVHNIDYFTARVGTSNVQDVLKGMEGILAKVDGSHLFEYNFLDKQWELFYREDQKRQVIFLGIAILTILIACLGLFGLATYMSEQRTKEIGVRKVLGATVSNIVSMLSADFLKLVIIAAVIAFPVAWLFMRQWLQDFAYRINIGWWVFAIAGALALLIALATVSFQAIRAAIANPVKSLRTE